MGAPVLDVAIIGGGPAGLAAALVLGRSRKQVVVFDGGTPRNATAQGVYGFLSRDGISPTELRHLAQEELRAYPTVELRRNTHVTAIHRAGKRLVVVAGGVELEARRVLLCTGVIDEPLPLEGSRELWGTSLFECPYCHAYEVRDRGFAFWAPSVDEAGWVQLLRSWTADVMLFTNGAFAVPDELRRVLTDAGIPIEERRIIGLARADRTLTSIVVEGDVAIPRDVLFFRPVQRQTPLVTTLAVAVDAAGFVRVDGEHRTSIPGIHAAGDLTSHYHGALVAAASGSRAAHCINHDLTVQPVAVH